MEEVFDEEVGVPYLTPGQVPLQAAAVLPFLTPPPGAPTFPRLYAASLGEEYIDTSECVEYASSNDAGFVVKSCFVLVGYGGVLCGCLADSLELNEATAQCDVTEPIEAKTHETRNTDYSLDTMTFIPFCLDDTLDPVLGSLLRIFTVVEDPTWCLFVSHAKREENGSDCILHVKILRIPSVAEADRLHRALNSLVLHHFGGSSENSICQSLMSVEELFATARRYSDSVVGEPAWDRLFSLRLTNEEILCIAKKMILSQPNLLMEVTGTKLEETPPLAVAVRPEAFTNEVKTEGESGGVKNAVALEEKGAVAQQREVLRELASVRAQYRAVLREGNELMARIGEEECRWNKIEMHREEEQRKRKEHPAALPSEHNEHIRKNVCALEAPQQKREKEKEKEKEKEEESSQATARAVMAGKKRKKTGKGSRGGGGSDKKFASTSNVTSREVQLQKVRADNTALRRLIEKLTHELKEEEQTMENLSSDLRGFMGDINKLEKAKLLLTVEHSMLMNATALLQRSLRDQKEKLRQEQEAAAAEQREISRRLLVQQERTKKSLYEKNGTTALLHRLKTTLSK
ncbi:hypothetical protein MOQ_000420 [Trypanosoma cruzi marinkellei]|uniref:Uncharacterized protein n=1 Tax=Trypanosoma cruzi marinkellei TaxID=85056 RepID=K2PEE8_TRYCR|nr:hypothetical protein MOQ_000420 [Trypanosoma cruzi marinkellei]